MPLYTDQLLRPVFISSPPKRIISLVPSQTELLYSLGLEKEVIGLTKFCVHPAHWLQTKQKIGGTKKLNIVKIKTLRPHFILANKDENVKEQIEELAKDFPVWISDVTNLSSAMEMMLETGKITDKEKEASDLIIKIKIAFSALAITHHAKVNTAYLIWRDPYMTVGGDTFIHQMMDYAGFKNVYANKTRYPLVEISELASLNCELLLLSSEPYPFKQKHIEELHLLLPNTKILLADGELFSWYGSRLLDAPDYFKKLYLQAVPKQ